VTATSGPVRQIPAKLAAAVGNARYQAFLLSRRRTLTTPCPRWHPTKPRRLRTLLTNARDRLQINYVADVAELLKQTLDEESVSACSFAVGFFGQVKNEGSQLS